MKYFLLLVISFFSMSQLYAQLPAEFSDQVISSDWDLPLGLEFDEQGRMFVWEKAGKVFIVDTSGNKLSTPLIDIHEEVGNWRDHGLLGFALDPDFLINGHYYLLYAVNRHYLQDYGTPSYVPDSISKFVASIGRVTRYTADPSNNFETTVPDSRKILIGDQINNGFPLYHESHGVGSLVFGEDGTLLVSCGDGNSNTGPDIGGEEFGSYATQALADGVISEDEDIGALKSQYLGSLGGKVLRINPDNGEGIASNPFYDASNPSSPASRTWSYGLRNPFRMTLAEGTGSLDPQDGHPGTLYIGDVGASQWEELNIADKGGLNFGWPFKEGLLPYWGMWNAEHPENKLAPNPLFDGNSCQQEFFNFKQLFGEARIDGQIFFPNPCNDNIPIPESANPKMETVPILTWGHNEYNLPTKTKIPSYDSDGKLRALDITDPESPIESDIFDGNSSIAGVFYQGDNFPEYYKGLYFHADYSGWIKLIHFDENNNIQKIEPFHDFSRQIIQLIEHPKDGCLYYISFHNGGTIHKICYGGNPPPIAIAKADTIYGSSPLLVNFDASESYDPFDLPITYHWDFGDGNESSAINPIHEFSTLDDTPTPFEVKLTVTDSLGLSSESTIIISLNNTPPQVQITNPKDSSFYAMNDYTIYNLNAVIEDLEHDEEDLSYEWQTFVHHNTHVHPEASSFDPRPSTIITPVGCEDDATYWFRIKLTVTDAAGLKSSDESLIFPYCGPDFFEIENFIGQASDSYIDLNWDISAEEDIMHYEVQRSPYFETIATTPSTGLGAYSHTDMEPLLGDNLYRIKAMRSDGIFEYSDLIKVPFPPKPDFNIFPNPAKDRLFIELKNVTSELVSFELFDATGKLLSQVNWSANPGTFFSESIITQELPEGILFFRLKDGDVLEEGKIVVVK